MTTTLHDVRRDLLAKAQNIVSTAQSEGRDVTADERQQVKDITTEVDTVIDPKIRAAEQDQALLKQLGASGLKRSAMEGAGQPGPGVLWGAEGKGFLRLQKAAHVTAGRLAAQHRDDGHGAKAVLASGSVITGVPIDPDIVVEGRPATSLFDVLTSTRREVPTYRYIRQSVRTNNAAVVAPGATKPTSVYTIVPVDGELSVVAHLSEAIDEYLLHEVQGLQAFIQNEMAYGLAVKVEGLVVAAVAATEGTQSQAFDTDLLTTTRSAITKLEEAGAAAGFWMFTPGDWQTIELLKDGVARFYTNPSAPIDIAARRLWGAPVVVSQRATAGTATLFAPDAVDLSTDGMIRVGWAAVNDDFEKNQIRCRTESRFNTDVLRPFGVVEVALTDES